MTHLFYSLSASQVLGLVFFASIVIGSFIICSIGACIQLYHKLRLEHYWLHSDEFEGLDDPNAVLCYTVDPMRDDIHVEHAKEVLQTRAILGVPQMSVTHSTCLYCNDVMHCPVAFDPYNMDGDCLMTK